MTKPTKRAKMLKRHAPNPGVTKMWGIGIRPIIRFLDPREKATTFWMLETFYTTRDKAEDDARRITAMFDGTIVVQVFEMDTRKVVP